MIDVEMIKSDLTYRVIEAEKYNKLEIGNHMQAYVWDGSNLVSSENEVLFYPIFGDDKIVAILTMFDPQGDQSYTVGIDFAQELNVATASGLKDYYIVEAGSKIYVHANDQASLLVEYGKPMDASELQTDEVAPLSEDRDLSDGGPETDGRPVVSQGLSINYEESNSLTLSELNSYISANVEDLPSDQNVNRSTDIGRIDITPTNRPQTRKMVYLKTQILNQGNTEHCTFYAATIIGNYLTKRTDTPRAVMTWAGKTFGNIIDAQNVINKYYGQNYSYIYDIYGKAANQFITRGYPLYAAFYNPSVTKGHAMAVTGYSDAGDSGIGVVETLLGQQKAIFPSNGKYITRAYSKNCAWTATLFYKYW